MIEKITPRKLNNSKDARIQGALEMYDAYNVSINEFTDPSGDSSFSSNSISGTDTGDAGVIKPAKGNHAVFQDVAYLPEGIEQRRIVGSVSDEVNGVIYCFLRSSVGAEQGVYVLSGDTLDPVFTSKIFNFPSNGFVKADIVYAKEGPIIYFTDGENEPRKLHVNKAAEIQALNLDSNDSLRLHDFLMVCPKAPMHRPSFSFRSDPSVATNFAGSQGFQFAYQCIYDTGEETALSPYSNVAVPPSYLNQGSLSEPALNTDNLIEVRVPYINNGVQNFTDNISKIRLLVRPAGRGAFFEVEEKDATLLFNDNVPFEFSNDTLLSGVPQEDVDKLNEGVPKKAKTQAVINDRLMYGNYTEGFDELDGVSCVLDAYYNQRGEEFTNLEIGIKKVILPVGYDVGTGIQYDSDLKPFGTASDNSGDEGSLVYNRRTAYQFDLSSLPSVVDAGTQLRLRLTIRPDKNFEIYDSRNSFHSFKNVGYDAGQNDDDALSINPATVRKIKKVEGGNDFDADTPAVLQFNKGVIVTDCKWNAVGVESTADDVLTPSNSYQISTGHSPSCPFIIPSTACTFSLAFDFNQKIEGSDTIKEIISKCLKNYFMTGSIDANGSDPLGVDVTLVAADSNRQSTSLIDQQLSNSNNYGILGSFNADVAETIIQIFRQSETWSTASGTNLQTDTNHLPSEEPHPYGFVAMNTGELKTSLFYVDEANTAVVGGDNDIGPIFCLEIDELINDEYVTMIPKINKSGTLNWYWASKEFFTDGGDPNIFLDGTTEIPVDVYIPANETYSTQEATVDGNLYFSLTHPFAADTSYNQYFLGSDVNGLVRGEAVFDSVNENLSEDFKQEINFGANSTIQERLTQIGYLTESPTSITSKVLKKVSLAEDFSGNNEFNLYSIVDGEVNVRRSTVSGPENQNFWYGLLYSCEYLGKQNNMFPLSRGWKGGGGYPGLFHGLFSYGNKSEYSDEINPEGVIGGGAILSESALDAILDESYPEVEVLNFASAVYNSSISLDPQSRSFKRYCSHDFGVVFFDERGRPGNVNPLGSVYVGGFKESQNTGAAFVTAKFTQTPGNIPSWAHYYRMVYGGNSTIDDFVQYTAGGAFVAADSGGTDGLIYVSLNYLQENADVSYTRAFGAVKEDGDKDMYTFSAGDKLRIISYFAGEETSTRVFVNEADHRFDVVGTVTLGKEDNPLVGENEDVHPAKMGQFVILKNNFRATGFSFADVSQGRQIGAGTNTSDIYDQGTNFWNKRCVFEIYSPSKNQDSENKIYYEIGKTYNIIKSGGFRSYQTPTVVLTEGDVFFRKAAVNMQPFDGSKFEGLIGNGNGTFEERSEPNFESYYLESKTFTDSFPGADVKPFGKPRIVSREKEEVVSPSSIKFSDKTNPASNTIRYSSFNNSKFPYKDLQNSDGPISYMLNLNDSLFCIQQLKCSSIPVARTVLADALGNETVVTSSKVLGTERYYSGMYGSSHPESVVNVDNTVYFASSDHRQVYRFDGSQGVEVISGKGMGGFFDRTLLLDKDKENRVVGGYDPDTDEFILSVGKDISEFSTSGFINPPDQPSGSVIADDSVEGFVGLTDEIGGGLSSSDLAAVEALVDGANYALGLEQATFISILDNISTITDFLNQDFSAEAEDGLTVPLGFSINGEPQSIGPFSTASSYNAELLLLQESLYGVLGNSVDELIFRYQQVDQGYINAFNLLKANAAVIVEQFQTLYQIITTASGLLFGSGVEDPMDVIDQALLDAGFSSGQETIGTQLAFWEAIQEAVSALQEWYSVATPVTVDSAYVLEEVYGAGAVSVPAEFLESEPYHAIFLSSGLDEPTIGEDIDVLLASFTEGAEQGLSIDVSGILVDVFSAISSSTGSQDNYVNFLEQQLYGSDQTAGGGDGGYVELYEDTLALYNDLLTVAYGSDQTPFSEGGDGLDGLEGEVKALESLIDSFVLYQDQLFNAAGNLSAAINATYQSNGQWEYSAEIQNADGSVETRTETFMAPNIGGEYGYSGAGYAQLLQLIQGGQVDLEELQNEIAALNIEVTNRTAVMNAVIDDYIGFTLDSYNDDFRTDVNGEVTALVIAGVLALLANRIPDQALLIKMYSRLFNYINTDGDVVDAPSQDNPLGVDFDEVVSTSGGGELNILNANPSTASGNIESLFLTALDKALEKILETVMSQNNETVTQSAYSLAQWYNAWNNIANNNTGAINPVTNYTEMQIGDFAGQVITPLQSGGIETFSQLITFLQQAEFNADQVKTIVNGFKYGNDSGSNDHLFADITGDSSVATADLLSFLGAFGAGSNNAPFNVFARFDGQELGAGLPN